MTAPQIYARPVAKLSLEDMKSRMRLNVDEALLPQHIRANVAKGYKEARPYAAREDEVALLAGGPSLELFRGHKGPIITVNGAYKWALEHGYTPNAQIIVDPRELNKRFTQPVIPGCQYLICSQCHPSVAESVPHDQVRLWHSGDTAAEVMEKMSREDGKERTWFPVCGGSSVMLRALPLLVMLGIRKIRIWGFDSCLKEGAHHAYEQPENDSPTVVDITVGGRTFECHIWMAVQAQEFVELIKRVMPEEVELAVEGDGLISHILQTGAQAYGGISLASL